MGMLSEMYEYVKYIDKRPYQIAIQKRGVTMSIKPEKELKELARILKCDVFEVADNVAKLIENIRELEEERDRLTNLLNEKEG